MKNNPGKPLSITAHNTPPPRNTEEKPPMQHKSQEKVHQPRSIGTAEFTAAASGVTARSSAGILYLEYIKKKDSVNEKQKAGLRETFAFCVTREDFDNTQAIFNLRTYGVPENEMIYCLQSAKRLKKDQYYVIEDDQAVPFAKTDERNRIIALSESQPQKLIEMNEEHDALTIIENETTQMLANASPNHVPSLSVHADAVRHNTAKAKKRIKEASIAIVNPQKETSSVSVDLAKEAIRGVDLAVQERDTEAKALSNETQKQSSQAESPDSSAPKKKLRTNSGSKMASIGNVFSRGEQEKHCSMVEPVGTSPSNLDGDLRLIRGLFVVSLISWCLYLFFRHNRLKKDEEERQEHQQNIGERESLERKEYSEILIVLKKSNFLTILYNYKMQKITLREAKDLLSDNFGLSNSEILSILNNA